MFYAQACAGTAVIYCLVEHHAERAHVNAPSARRRYVEKLHLLWMVHRIVESFGLVVDACADRLESFDVDSASIYFIEGLAAGYIDVSVNVLAIDAQ